jgi:hypothetical protein
VSGSGFARGASFSVFEALRPEIGEKLDRAAFATYSLDLVAVAALVLSLGRAGEQELEAGPLSLVDALAEVAPRIDIVHQADRLKPAARSYGILHTLDRRIHAVRPPRGSSFHPKIAVARYLNAKGKAIWRLWLGSRNLTGGQDREAGLLLVGRPGAGAGKRLPDVAAMARELLEPVEWIGERSEELAAVRWRAPDGVVPMGLQWRRAGERKRFATQLKGASDTVAISPFVDDAGLKALGAGDVHLLTTVEAAEGLTAREGLAVATCRSPAYEVEMPAEPPAAGPAIDEVSVPEPIGLHAKLLLRRSGEVGRLWIGSSNLTGRGMDGPNAEVMAELQVSAETVQALTDFAIDGAPFKVGKAVADPDLASRRMAERALDLAIADVVAADLELHHGAEGLELASRTGFDLFLAEHRLESWLMTRPATTAAWKVGASSVTLVRGGVPLRDETVLVCFRAERLAEDCPPRSWAQAVLFPGHDADARDRAATAAYIGVAGASAWVRAQLEGIIGAETTTWTGSRRWAGSEFAGAADELPLALEEVLSAWARNPVEFETRARGLEVTLAALGEELASAPVYERDEVAIRRWSDVRDFWSSIRLAIGNDD